MLNCYELYLTQSFRSKYGSKKMLSSQVISSILLMTQMSEYVLSDKYCRFLSIAPQIFSPLCF